MTTREPLSIARSTSVKTSSEPYDLDSSAAVSGVLPHGAGAGNLIRATLSLCRSPSRPAIIFSARLSIDCAAVALLALARIRLAWSVRVLALRLGVRPLALATPLVGLALGEVGLPAHVVDVDLAAVGVEVQHLVDGLLEQRVVVADHDQPALVRLEEPAQPDDRVGVEVVGRLVEEQRLGAGEQDPGQLDATALTTGQRLQRLGEDPLLDAEAAGDRGGLGLGGVPTAGVQLGVGALVAAHRLLAHGDVVAAHVDLGLPEPAYDVVEAARGQDPVAGDHLGVADPRVLREVADLAGGLHGARRGQRLAGEDLRERGLAGAVAPDQADLVAGRHPEADVLHEEACTGTDLELVGGDHESSKSRCGYGPR